MGIFDTLKSPINAHHVTPRRRQLVIQEYDVVADGNANGNQRLQHRSAHTDQIPTKCQTAQSVPAQSSIADLKSNARYETQDSFIQIRFFCIKNTTFPSEFTAVVVSNSGQLECNSGKLMVTILLSNGTGSINTVCWEKTFPHIIPEQYNAGDVKMKSLYFVFSVK